MRSFDDKYAHLALRMRPQISKKVDRFQLAPTLWKLADYLQTIDNGKKHEQHLIMLASKWVGSGKYLPES